jgi:hypothetical protein
MRTEIKKSQKIIQTTMTSTRSSDYEALGGGGNGGGNGS